MVPTKGVLERVADANRNELTDEERSEFLEESVNRFLGISLAEFMRLAQEGNLPDHPAVAHLVLLTGANSTYC